VTVPHDERAPHRNQRFVECDNTLDPYSVASVEDADSQEIFRTRLLLAVPSEDDQIDGLVVVGPHKNICTNDYPTYARYNSGDGNPQPGEEWGVASGGGVLRSGHIGFIILGDPSGGLVRVARSGGAARFFLGKVVTSTIAAGGTGTAEKYNHGWAASGTYYTVVNQSDVAWPVGLKIRWGKYPGWNGWIGDPVHLTEC
jgi:hypothetical protein